MTKLKLKKRLSGSKIKQVDPNYVTSVQKEIVESQNRTLHVLSESELVAANIGISLKEQGETLARTKQLTHHIGMNLQRSDRDIRAIKSWCGAMFNKMVKPSSCGSFSQDKKDHQESEKNQKRLDDYEEEICKAIAHADINQEVIRNGTLKNTKRWKIYGFMIL